MSDSLPRGEKLRRAIRWISGEIQEAPERALSSLVNDATLRFDLSPRESEMLIAFYRDATRPSGDASDSE